MVTKQVIAGRHISAFAVDPNSLHIVGLDPEPDGSTAGAEHPLWDARAFEPLDEAMILNVMAFGILEPVLVRKNGSTVEVIDGRHRVRWAREANVRLAKQGAALITVPVMVRKDTDAGHMGVMVSANEIRKEDSFRGRQWGAKLALKLSKLGWGTKEIAVAYGVSEQAVSLWLKFWDLSPAIQAEVEAGVLAPSSAVQLAGLSHGEQVAALQEAQAARPAPANGAAHAGRAARPVAAREVKAAVSRATRAKSTQKGSGSPQNGGGAGGDGGAGLLGKKLLASIVVAGSGELDPNFIKGVRFATFPKNYFLN